MTPRATVAALRWCGVTEALARAAYLTAHVRRVDDAEYVAYYLGAAVVETDVEPAAVLGWLHIALVGSIARRTGHGRWWGAAASLADAGDPVLAEILRDRP